MRVLTARFLLGALVVASLCVIVSPAEAGPFRRRGASSAAACCPGEGYGYGTGYATAYSGGSGYASTPCCGDGSAMPMPVAYGSSSSYQSGYGGRLFGGRMSGARGSYQPSQVYGASGYSQPGQVYGAGGYYQPGSIIPAGGVPMPLPGTGSSGSTDTLPANAEKAKITDIAFEPATITIKPGTAIRWTNDGQKPHTVTSLKGDWDSGDIQPGKDFTATFTKPGTFEYYCRYHKEMKGTIVVK
jgi:plastocyanin